MKSEIFLILAIVVIFIGTCNLSAEGAKNPVPTFTPTGFSATAVSPTQIDLSWMAPTQNYGKLIVGYKIEQSLGNGVYDTVVDNTGSAITTYSMTGLKTGKEYTYRISALYSDDTSTDPSNSATATPLSTSTPPPITPLSSPMTNVKFDFAPSDGTILTGIVTSASDYLEFQYKKDPRSIILDKVPTTESINNNLDRLISYQTNHQSPDSVPAPLIAKAVSSTQINLSWLPPIESYGQKLLGYKIELKNAPGDYQILDDNTGNDTTKYAITGLTPESTYTYRISAVYPGTHSNPSNEASATTLVQPSQPVQKPNQTTSNSSLPSTTPPPAIIPSPVTPQVNNVRLDFTAPDGSLLSGVILSQSDYQQFIVIMDPRAILSNVTSTTYTINKDLAGLIRYQNLHAIQQTVNPPQPDSNSSQPSTNPSNTANLNLLYGVITSVLASSVVGIITWLVKTKVARKIAKEYHFTLEKFSSSGVLQVRIRNSGETIEDCTVICEKETCDWTDTNTNQSKHVYEGSISSVKIPEEYEHKNPLISVKSGKKTLKKIRLTDMAHG